MGRYRVLGFLVLFVLSVVLIGASPASATILTEVQVEIEIVSPEIEASCNWNRVSTPPTSSIQETTPVQSASLQWSMDPTVGTGSGEFSVSAGLGF